MQLIQLRSVEIKCTFSTSDLVRCLQNHVIPTEVGASAGGTTIQRGWAMRDQSEMSHLGDPLQFPLEHQAEEESKPERWRFLAPLGMIMGF